MPGEPPIVSTGRGGSGNIGRDTTVYADGGIVREGYQGESKATEYSTGRGGAGNIGSPSMKPQDNRHDQEVIPDTNLRPSGEYSNYHTGRGGEGNAHREKGHEKKESLGDKLKHKLHLDKKKEDSA